MENDESEEPLEATKRKSIDEMEWLASEVGVPFRREEEHLALVMGGVEAAIESGVRETREVVAELKAHFEDQAARLEKYLQSICYAVWIICGALVLIAVRVMTQ